MFAKLAVYTTALLSFILPGTSVFACTDFKVTAKDNTVVVARSMEFAAFFDSNLVIHPREQLRQSLAPDDKKGYSWTSKYGMVTVNGFGLDLALDGINEEGLTAGCLWMPGSQYQQVPAEKSEQALLVNDLMFWILGNFKTVEEIKQELPKIFIWGKAMKEFGDKIPPTHFAIHDANGNSILIEFMDGQQKVYDNPIGVTTNNPTFDWHTTNLRNYINLTSKNADPISLAGQMIQGTGQGSGWLGLPGDWTPPSRFIRAAALVNTAKTPANAADAITLCNHIQSSIDIPFGAIKGVENNTAAYDYTQWVVIKDLTNKKFFFRTYHNMTLRMVDLTKIDFSGKTKSRALKMEQGNNIVDVTKDMQSV